MWKDVSFLHNREVFEWVYEYAVAQCPKTE